jgi:L-alanine-DL-glutamate epimerase-like enolase superfamily enzyme
MTHLTAACETFDLARPFAISSGVIDALTVLVVKVEVDGVVGRGEGVPSAARMVSRAESRAIAEQARLDVLRMSGAVAGGLEPEGLLAIMPPGPGRNALDCALWDLRAKRTGLTVADMLGVEMPAKLVTAKTIPLCGVADVRAQACSERESPLFKLKLGGAHDVESVAAVRVVAPTSTIIVDVNGGWTLERLQAIAPALASLGVELIEQPLPPADDAALNEFESPVPLCADESCQARADLDRVAERYDFINIKLDKTGGLTEAMALAQDARRRGLGVMVGCMAGTSLSMAPASIVASLADFVDLDGPLLLREDRPGGYSYVNGRYQPSATGLWGQSVAAPRP